MEFTAKIEKLWIEKAKKLKKTIVLPEAYFSDRVLSAGYECARMNLCNIVLLTDKDNIKEEKNVKVVNLLTSELRPILSSALYIKRKDKGLTEEDAIKLIDNPIYFATMMVELGLVDGMVAGAEISTTETFKPALQIIKGKKGEKVSSYFIMVKDNLTYILSDCGMNINPSTDEIVAIAKQSANSAKTIADINPVVALLSYSTMGSAEGDSAIKMRDASNQLKSQNLDFIVDGEMQLDSAVVPSVAELKCPNSQVKGHANVLIFPDLASGNIGYKLMQRFGGFNAYGPIAQGLNKPINDVSRGATVKDIVIAIAITILQN